MNNFGNITRYFKYLEQSSFFYFYILCFSVVVFGFMGILPLGITSFKKVQTIQSLKMVIGNFQKKEAESKLMKEDYITIKPYLYFLDIYMPTDINVDDYLISLNAVAVNNGFSIKRLAPLGEEANNSLAIDVSLEGFGELPDLIQDIEDLKRITRITDLEVTKIKGRERIELSLQIFSR